MAFVPINDENPRIWIRYHFVTMALIAACVLTFLWQLGLSSREHEVAFFRYGVIPAVLWGNAALPAEAAVVPSPVTLFTSMFLHGGWLHLIGNMLFLWVFGDNVEDAMGHRRFIVFYLLCGTVAGLAHAASVPGSTVPTVGASGAIAGVLGAYFVLHPKVGIWGLLFGIIPIKLPTVIVLGSWIGLEVLNALTVRSEGAGIAWWAHVGGFVAGAALIFFFRQSHVVLWDSRPGARIRRPISFASRRGPWGRRGR